MAYVKFSLQNGGTVLLESDDAPGALPVSALGDRAVETASALEAALDGIRSLAASMTTRLREGLPQPPREIELTFGIKASAEMNALVVAKAGGEANFTVKLKWVIAEA